MRLFISALVLIHGSIHFLGFLKAFQLRDIKALNSEITKPLGLLWLLTGCLFLIVTSSYFLKKDWWFYIAFIAIITSQTLIIVTWKDARFGTSINLIILLVSTAAFGNYKFQKMVNHESSQLLHSSTSTPSKTISHEDLKHLPDIVQKWVLNSGVLGKPIANTIYLEQKGKMRTKSNGKWMPFTAEQYVTIKNPSFIWKANTEIIPRVSLLARDKLYKGNGNMLIQLFGLVPVVSESNNFKINQGTMQRYLAEICWFPQAAISPYINWETLDNTSAIATITYRDVTVSGIFKFTESGVFLAFETMRYYGGDKNAKLEKWLIQSTSHTTFNGIKIPNKCKVIWQLKEGDFHWLDIEIIKVNHSGF